jgi:vacuole morphology and inheritance protein 14
MTGSEADDFGYIDEQIQSLSLKWISSFLTFVQEVMVPFTPRLIAAILPNLAHHVSVIAQSIRPNLD